MNHIHDEDTNVSGLNYWRYLSLSDRGLEFATLAIYDESELQSLVGSYGITT